MRDFRDDMIAAIEGRPVDRIPWVPRLDLWFRANQLARTMPPGLEDASLEDVCDVLNAGLHCVIPDFKGDPSPEAELDRALGLYNLSTMPYHIVLEGVERRVTTDGDRIRTEYHTPEGTVDTVVRYTEDMRKAGVTVSHVEQPAIRDVKDYAAVGYIFEHARVEPNYDGINSMIRRVGQRGLVTGFISLAASPMHLIQRELMAVDQFFYAMSDHQAELERLSERIALYWQRVLEVAVDSPARIYLLGANYDAMITYPPFFRDHIAPWLGRFGQMLHQRGKYLLTHMDGENTGLLEHYAKSSIDVADSVCPYPMTKLSFAESRAVLKPAGITIMGGIPSIALVRSSMNDRQFDEFLDGFFREIDCGDRLILGISDTTPPGADFDRLRQIGRRVADFGPPRR